MYVEREILELRQRVGKLERQVAFLLEKADLDYVDTYVDELEAKVLDVLRKRNKIEAINVFREETGADLKTAKDYVDALEGKL